MTSRPFLCLEMDFAKQQLEKYGWREGKGLGKSESGISTAVRPKLKFDNAGLGHNASEQFTFNWWENVYKQASENITVKAGNGTVEMQVANENGVNITTKEYAFKDLTKQIVDKNTRQSSYGSFIKAKNLEEDDTDGEQESCMNNSAGVTKLSDEDLFAICGGRTAHKGARHGLKLSGKLARLEKQEKLLQKQLKKISAIDGKEKKQTNELKVMETAFSDSENISKSDGNERLARKKEKLLRKQEDLLGKQLRGISLSENVHNKTHKLKKKLQKCEETLNNLTDDEKFKVLKRKKKKKKKSERSNKEAENQKADGNNEEAAIKVPKTKKKGATQLFLESLGIINNRNGEKRLKSERNGKVKDYSRVVIDKCKDRFKTLDEEDLKKDKLHHVKSKIKKHKKKKLKKNCFCKETAKTVNDLNKLSLS